MAPMEPMSGSDRPEAARLANIVLRFASLVAHPPLGHTPPGQLKVGTEAFVFSPSWTPVATADVEQFLIALPGPALMSPGLSRGTVHLTLVHDLNGDRRQWAEKTLSNQAAFLDSIATQLGLSPTARVLLELDEEMHVFALSTVRYWAQYLAVEVGWTLSRLDADPRADACLMLLRADGRPFPGRSSMRHHGRRLGEDDST